MAIQPVEISTQRKIYWPSDWMAWEKSLEAFAFRRRSSHGIGPRFGLDIDWKFTKHFGTFMQTGCSMLWSYYRANARSYDTNTLEDYADVLIANQNYKPHSLTPMCQFILGLENNWTFKDSYEFLVQAGWENQFWFFQNQHASAIANTSLILQGLTLAFQFKF